MEFNVFREKLLFREFGFTEFNECKSSLNERGFAFEFAFLVILTDGYFR